MAKNGRRKGASAELEVVRLIEPWWRQHEPECVIKRTPGSGGWAKGKGRETFGTGGDLVFGNPDERPSLFPFSVEVKRRENWSAKTFLAGSPCPVWGWWDQTVAQAEETKREPMLWFRKSREEWRVMLDPYRERSSVVYVSAPASHAVPARGLAWLYAVDLFAVHPSRLF
jgi:hypothetical protein